MTNKRKTRFTCTERLPRTGAGKASRDRSKTSPYVRLALCVLLQALKDAADGECIRTENLEPWAELAGVRLPDFESAGPVVTPTTLQRQEDARLLLA